MDLSIILYGPFRSGCSFFLEIHFCVAKFGIRTQVPIFKFVAGVNREFIWELIFCLCNNCFVFSLINFLVFLFLLKIHSVYVPEAIFKKFVDDESDLHRGYVVVGYNKMILWLVENNLVFFLKNLLWTISIFVAFDLKKQFIWWQSQCCCDLWIVIKLDICHKMLLVNWFLLYIFHIVV